MSDDEVAYIREPQKTPTLGDIADAVAGMALERLQERIREIVRIEVDAALARAALSNTKEDGK